METSLSIHLGEFETTIANCLKERDLLATLNFAALFHETLFLTDTAMVDHKLILDSFNDEHFGLFSQIRQFMDKGILRVLLRDKMVAVGTDYDVKLNPTFQDLFFAWLRRDKQLFAGKRGFTTSMPENERREYNETAYRMAEENGALERYNADIPRETFRTLIKEQLDTQGEFKLRVEQLPKTGIGPYLEVVKEKYFTNAEFWRILRDLHDPIARELIFLHSHITQQCYANVTTSGQTGFDRMKNDLPLFNRELRHCEPEALSVPMTPPPNLNMLWGRAQVHLLAPTMEMLASMPASKIVQIRNETPAQSLFKFAKKPLIVEKFEKMQMKYLNLIRDTLNTIMSHLAESIPDSMYTANKVGLFLEKNIDSKVRTSFRKYAPAVTTWLLRSNGVPCAGTLSKKVHNLGVVMLRKPTPEADNLREQIPPSDFIPREIYALDPWTA